MIALHRSCKFEVIQLLIKYEANVNMLSNGGYNIFQRATRSSLPLYRFTNAPILKLILISGFDLKLLTRR